MIQYIIISATFRLDALLILQQFIDNKIIPGTLIMDFSYELIQNLYLHETMPPRH